MGESSIQVNDPSLLDIVWDERYRIGVAQIDRQHQALFALYNRLVARFYGQDEHSISIGEALNDLVAYAEEHFRDEEAWMACCGYRELAQHAGQHRYLIGRVCQYRDEHQDGVALLTFEVLQLVRQWLLDHVLHDDMALKSLSQENGSLVVNG